MNKKTLKTSVVIEMKTIITIYRANELKECLLNSLNMKNVVITFLEDNIFIDNTITIHGFGILDTINGASKITKGDPVSLKINPIYLLNGINLCSEGEKFKIVVLDSICKIVQRDRMYVFSTVEKMELNQSDYENRRIEGDYSKEINCEHYSLTTSMNNFIRAFEMIFKAEEYQGINYIYNISIKEERITLRKGTDDNFLSISFDGFRYSGKPTSIKLNENLERILKLFIKDCDIKINCVDESMIHFSQNTGINTKREVMMGGMTQD